MNVNDNRMVLTGLCLPDHIIIAAEGPLTKCDLVVTMLSDVQDMGWQIMSVIYPLLPIQCLSLP
jgi:hypothetical protein